ncbi:cysteine desulfurase family protein [Gynurincola endophyticus]|uniref:cysteine desulfurase family protein n=1 Tax=Gynurincola endophyticus TaxID=2479004 RepID=UPI000F8D0161|nr:IscS subfamily cysteine desulfurase [Gynurincola endophyticus]
MNTSFIYLDYNATTPCDERVLQAALPYMTEFFGNAASNTYSLGTYAANAVKIARGEVAKCIGADESEVIFTSGATESCNIAIRGVAETYQHKGKHIITAVTEHKAVLDTCNALEKEGYQITYLATDQQGNINLDILEKSITPATILIALMYANNETGVIHPVQSIGKIAKKHGVIFFCDATQALGKIAIDVVTDEIDLMAVSAHKIYALKGTGALYIRRKQPRVTVAPFLFGGGHEKGLRSGTLNVPGIVSMGKACSIITAELIDIQSKYTILKTKLLQQLLTIPQTVVNGNIDVSLPNTVNVSFLYTEGKAILAAVKDKIGISAGSACTAHLNKPSYVLLAMGHSENRAAASFRISIGRNTTEAQIDEAVNIFRKGISEVRAASYIWKNYQEGRENLQHWK